jgi:tRNA threonylcarbamoyladenosine biosynthesis protein TsaE
MITSHSPEETFDCARQYAATLQRGEVIALCGELGAGKTQFVKGLARGLGNDADVTSPTFTLIHEYSGGRLPLFHIDLYRLDSLEETLRIGIDDYLHGEGVTVIEWADKFPSLIPQHARWIRFHTFEGRLREIDGAELP